MRSRKQPVGPFRGTALLSAALGLGVAALGMAACGSTTSPRATTSATSAPAPSHPVAPVTKSGTSSALEFDSPSGLIAAGGHLWLTNLAGNSVTEVDPSSGAWIRSFRGAGYGFDGPTAITASGPDLFVANAAGFIVEMRADDGGFVRNIAGSQYDLVDPVAIADSGDTVLVLNAGRPSASPAVPGSITEIDAATGALLRTVSGPGFAFDDPAALTVSGPDVFVADKGSNSVTEVSTATGGLVHVIADKGLSAPDGITVGDGHVWVANGSGNSATEIDAVTGAVTGTFTDSDGDYGFGHPASAVESGGNVFIASPFGTSPMVTKLSADSGHPSWYMCNTNGPYYFSLISGLAVAGDHLWVASRSGANSKTPAAKTGSLTELDTTTGALVMTLPA
jgi:hypothetical protein